mmetsp:Transcript_20635/g.55694  ORF Transcript_20635/g.55694 Transcript_20635/m.55694 type:complete len:810 (-) Transcript_20635:214-2643(-)
MPSVLVAAVVAAAAVIAGGAPSHQGAKKYARLVPGRVLGLGNVTSIGKELEAEMGHYIVDFGPPAVRRELKHSALASAPHAVEVRRHYDRLLHGFAGKLTKANVEHFRALGARVTPDRVVHATDVSSWGLDRLDQDQLPLDDSFSAGSTGASAHVYVIDTGIYLAHEEFEGRIGNGYDFFDNDDEADDCDGHGTHVASTAAGTRYGVAPGATVHPVRVLGCSQAGAVSDVLAGMEWVANEANDLKIAIMSLGTEFDVTVNRAVNLMHSAGVTVVAAAGNEGQAACNLSPAAAPRAITVAATNDKDEASFYTNFGTCVDIFAPGGEIVVDSEGVRSGRGIIAAYAGHPKLYEELQGTSMAAPHAGGVAALLADALGPSEYSPGAVWNLMKGHAVLDELTLAGLPGSTPNALLRTRVGEVPFPPPASTAPPSPPSLPPAPPSPPPYGLRKFFFEVQTDAQPEEVSAELYVLWDGVTPTLVDACSLNFTGAVGVQAVAYYCWTYGGYDHKWVIKDAGGDGLGGDGYYKLVVGGVEVASGANFGVQAEEFITIAVGSPPPPAPPPTDDLSTLTIKITPDSFPQEVSWTLERRLSEQEQSYGSGEWLEVSWGQMSSLAGTLKWKEEIHGDKDHRFTIVDDAADGICCLYGSGSFSLAINGDTFEDSTFTDEFASVTFNPSEMLSIPSPPSPPAPPPPPSPGLADRASTWFASRTVIELVGIGVGGFAIVLLTLGIGYRACRKPSPNLPSQNPQAVPDFGRAEPAAPAPPAYSANPHPFAQPMAMPPVAAAAGSGGVMSTPGRWHFQGGPPLTRV